MRGASTNFCLKGRFQGGGPSRRDFAPAGNAGGRDARDGGGGRPQVQRGTRGDGARRGETPCRIHGVSRADNTGFPVNILWILPWAPTEALTETVRTKITRQLLHPSTCALKFQRALLPEKAVGLDSACFSGPASRADPSNDRGRCGDLLLPEEGVEKRVSSRCRRPWTPTASRRR